MDVVMSSSTLIRILKSVESNVVRKPSYIIYYKLLSSRKDQRISGEDKNIKKYKLNLFLLGAVIGKGQTQIRDHRQQESTAQSSLTPLPFVVSIQGFLCWAKVVLLKIKEGENRLLLQS